VSHIPQFGDATESPAGDATSPTGDVDVSAGDAVSHAGDLLASLNSGICDTAEQIRSKKGYKYFFKIEFSINQLHL